METEEFKSIKLTMITQKVDSILREEYDIYDRDDLREITRGLLTLVNLYWVKNLSTEEDMTDAYKVLGHVVKMTYQTLDNIILTTNQEAKEES